VSGWLEAYQHDPDVWRWQVPAELSRTVQAGLTKSAYGCQRARRARFHAYIAGEIGQPQ
jgi:hypothetical protein